MADGRKRSVIRSFARSFIARHLTTPNRPSSVPPLAFSKPLQAEYPKLAALAGPAQLHLQRVRRPALSAQGSPQVVSDLLPEPSHASSSVASPGLTFLDQNFGPRSIDTSQAIGGFNDDYAELLSLIGTPSENRTFHSPTAIGSPYAASPAPTLAQPFTTPNLVSTPLDGGGPLFPPPAPHRPALNVAPSFPLGPSLNQTLFSVSDDGTKTNIDWNSALLTSPLTIKKPTPVSRPVSPIKGGRPATPQVPFSVTPQQRGASSRSVRGIASPLSIETSPTATAYEPSPAKTLYSPYPPSRMWVRTSLGGTSGVQSPASSPTKEAPIPTPTSTLRASPPKTLKCPHEGCTLMFARPHDLRRHTNIHTGILPFTCLACNRGFKRSDARQRHWKQDTDCKDLHMEMEERGYDGGGKSRRGRNARARKEAEKGLDERRGSSVALSMLGTGAPEVRFLGPPSSFLTRRASSTPLPDVSFPIDPFFTVPTPFVPSTPAPQPSLSLFTGNDNALFLDL
ncbi:hypothetical protein FRC04_008786 [Tulasnella sp. 424]|nr:hypothetical protein FRC04_008786 [Tulasnella sp. 424]